MFSHNSYLLLGELAQVGINIPFLIKNGYELMKCNYSFHKDVDVKGQVQTRARGGVVDMTISGVPTDELIEWSLNPRRYKDGAIVFCDDTGLVLEKITFTHAACVSMCLNFIATGKSYTSVDLILNMASMSIGTTTYNSEWINID